MLLLGDEKAAALIQTTVQQTKFRIALQPVVDAVTRRPVFHECLIRPTGPDGMDVMPGDFIEAAERIGFDSAIDRAIAQRANELLRASADLRLSINVSGQTACDFEFIDALFHAVDSDPSVLPRLIVEITETAPIPDLGRAKVFVERLQAAGVRVAIDDFGAGYTSFEALAALPVDMVKIDGRFIQNIAATGSDRSLLDAVLKFAASARVETVAEWVETSADADYLQARGVTYLQGHLFGLPKLAA